MNSLKKPIEDRPTDLRNYHFPLLYLCTNKGKGVRCMPAGRSGPRPARRDAGGRQLIGPSISVIVSTYWRAGAGGCDGREGDA